MKQFFIVLAAIFLNCSLFAQVPQKMSYQAIVRNATGELVKAKKINIRVSILQGSATGTVVYVETDTTTTNNNGLANIQLGAGKVVSGIFSTINWANGPFFIKTETDLAGGTNFTLTGVTQFLSVPYAFHAKTVEIDNVTDADADPANEIQTLSKTGNTVTLSKNGGSITDAVDDADADPLNEIQTISLNGNNLVLSNNGGSVTLPTTGNPPGGDNWGTQTVVTHPPIRGNGTPSDPLDLAQQNATNGQVLKWNGNYWAPGEDATGTGGLTLPYTGETDQATTHGYAIEINSSVSSGILGSSTSTDPGIMCGVVGIADSGQGRGVSGLARSSSGYNSGVYGASFSTEGTGVVGIAASSSGYNFGVAGYSHSETGTGVFGKSSGVTGGYGVIGETGGVYGVGVFGKASNSSGYASGVTGESFSNTGSGVLGINFSSTGENFGVKGQSNSSEGTGIYGQGLKYGIFGRCENDNGYAGSFQGRLIVTGNVGLGVENPVNKLDVAGAANLNSGIPDGIALRCNGVETIWSNGSYFVWGFGASSHNYFDKPIVIGNWATPEGHMLVVSGSAAKTDGSTWSNLSDVRLKNISGSYAKGLKEISALQPVTFTYKEGNARKLDSTKEQIGFVAQEVQEVFPEAVTTGGDGYLEFNMHAVNVALVNAIKELKAENDALKAENLQLKRHDEETNARLSKLERIIEASAMK